MVKDGSLKESSLVCPLEHCGLLRVAGEDALRFLQGQLSCDLHAVQPGKAILGACCNPQGRVVSNFMLSLAASEEGKQEESVFYLAMNLCVITLLLDHLKKYAVFFKVVMTSLADTHSGYAVLAEEPLFSSESADIMFSYQQGKKWVCQYWFSKADSGLQTYWQQRLTHKDDWPWQRFNLEDQLVYIGAETSGCFTPHMLNLDKLGAISFTKGCYTGQEVIARTHYKGTTKKHACLVNATELPKLMDDVYNHSAESCGTVVAVCAESCEEYQAGELRAYMVLVVMNPLMLTDGLCYLDKGLTRVGRVSLSF